MDRQQSVRWGAAQKDGSPGGEVARRGRVARMTATAAGNGYQQRSATAHNARTIRANLGYARPESGRSALDVIGSRNLSRAPATLLRDRLRRPWTKPVCRKVQQQSGSGEGVGRAMVRWVRPCRLGSGDDGQGAAHRRARPEAMRRVSRPSRRAVAWQPEQRATPIVPPAA